jgi:translation initiation factor 2 beta subunit (eIF-2beta)/eIF-5
MATLQISKKSGDDVADRLGKKMMLCVHCRMEGSLLSTKTIITNLSEIASLLKRPPNYIAKYYGIELGVSSIWDRNKGIGIINGKHAQETLQYTLETFVLRYVSCNMCQGHETVIKLSKHGLLQMKCNMCGSITTPDNNHRLATIIYRKLLKQMQAKIMHRKNEQPNNDNDGATSSNSQDQTNHDDPMEQMRKAMKCANRLTAIIKMQVKNKYTNIELLHYLFKTVIHDDLMTHVQEYFEIIKYLIHNTTSHEAQCRLIALIEERCVVYPKNLTNVELCMFYLHDNHVLQDSVLVEWKTQGLQSNYALVDNEQSLVVRGFCNSLLNWLT